MNVEKLAGRNFQTQAELQNALVTLYNEDKAEYIRQCGDNAQFKLFDENQYILLSDCIQEAGNFGQEYFFQDLWAAREILRSNVKHVYDIGSRMDGYIAHLLAMDIQVTMLDIRPFKYNIDGLKFIQANAMDMHNIADNSMETVSGLCSFEHFGLGRYGDPIDYDGWRKALHEIKRTLKVGGTFYLSVPVSNIERVQFNAHRIFNPLTIIEEVSPELTLHEFSYIADWKINTIFKGTGDIAVFKNFIKNNFKFGNVVGLFAFKKLALMPPPCYNYDFNIKIFARIIFALLVVMYNFKYFD